MQVATMPWQTGEVRKREPMAREKRSTTRHMIGVREKRVGLDGIDSCGKGVVA
jgi:hypothetical protein